MQKALTLARKGQGFVHPNPLVGCVVVQKNRVVGSGFHQRFGHAHAEVNALKQAGARARGATLYVNLEPCTHYGKTPPCVHLMKAYGIRRVVVAMQDPNPLVAGKGLQILRHQKIALSVGVLGKEAADLNRAFTHWIHTGEPFVTFKAATSLDGKVSTASGESKWITNEAARAHGHAFRAQVDAVAVGVSTVLADNPELTSHGKGVNPVRVVFDSQLRSTVQKKVYSSHAPTWLLTTRESPKMKLFEKKGVRVMVLPKDSAGRVSVSAALKLFGKEGIAHLLLEGGSTLAGAFFDAQKIHEVLWFSAPLLIGGGASHSAIQGRGIQKLKQALKLQPVEIGWLENNQYLRARVCLPD